MAFPVLLDVDTGIDDALAILLAARSPALQLLGVTCVNGNVGIDDVCRNTLQVLEAADRSDVPVARGSATPLKEKNVGASHVHGLDGLADLSDSLPDPVRALEKEEAVPFLAGHLDRAERPITLVPLGPLTNIARLLQEQPDAARGIERIVLMGGAIGMGNASAVSEFNIRQDPEAAAIVLASGLEIVMYTWDVFTQVAGDRSFIEDLGSRPHGAPRLAARILRFSQETFQRERVSIGDAGAVASVIAPHALTLADWPVQVELQGQHTRGMTVFDQRPLAWARSESEWQPVWTQSVAAATAVDAKALLDIFKQHVSSGGQDGAAT